MLHLGNFLAGIGAKVCRSSSLSRIDRKIYLSTLSRTNHELNKDSEENTDLNNALDEIMKTVPPESGALSPGDTLNIFRMLNKTFNLNYNGTSFKMNEHQNFPILAKATENSIPYYKAGEIIDMLRTIISLNVPLEDDISKLMISTLRTHTYDMSLNEIMLLDTFLRINGTQKTDLAKVLQRDIIQRFNLLTSRTRINFTYFEYMRRMIRFVHLNWHHIDNKVLENMSRNAAEQKIDINTAEEAMKIIMELSRSPDGCKYFKKILEKAFSVWKTSDVSIEMIHRVLHVLVQWKTRIDSDLFNDQRFVRTCAEKVMQSCNFDACFLIQAQFNQLKLVDYPLITFLSEHITEIDLTAPDTFYKIVTYCKACEVAAYVVPLATTEHIRQFPFENYFDPSMNWPMFAGQLHSLHIHRPQLIEIILKNEKSLEKFKVYLDLLKDIQTISLENSTYNDSNKNLGEDLLDIVGSNKLYESVQIDTNLTIPFLLKVDKMSKTLLPFDKTTEHPLKHKRREELIAILCEPKASEVTAFNLLCTKLGERKISIIVLDEGWQNLPLSKQVENIFTCIGTILKDKRKTVTTSSYTK